MSRLDDTSNCPVASACTSCGDAEDLDVVTLQSQVGVYCETLCVVCTDRGRLPKRYVVEAAKRVAEHCGHTGLTLDESADILEAEKDGGSWR